MGRCRCDSRLRLVPHYHLLLIFSHIFNAGIIFFRKSEWTHWFLDTVWDERNTSQLSEQGVMKSVLERLNEFEDSKHFVKIPQYMLSAYPEEISCHEDDGRPWQSGDWIIHFPVSVSISIFLLTR